MKNLAIFTMFLSLAFGYDHGHNIQTATPVGINSTTSGSIGVSSDNDYFQIIVPNRGVLIVSSTGTADMVGYLLNRIGERITANDDDGVGSNFRIYSEVQAGMYYIKVRNYNQYAVNNYYIRVNFSASANVSTQPAPAPQVQDDHVSYLGGIVNGAFVDGELATLVQRNSRQAGRIEVAGDVDFFKINTNRAGTLEVYSQSSSNMVGHIFDSSGTQVAGNDNGGEGLDFNIAIHLEANERYYIQVQNIDFRSAHDYNIVTSFTPDAQVQPITTPTPTPTTPIDDHGDDMASATSVVLVPSTNQAMKTGAIEIDDDNDYFKIELAQAGTLKIESIGQNTMRTNNMTGILYDHAGNHITWDERSGDGYNFKIERQLDAGVYYINIRKTAGTNNGSYTVSFDFTPDNTTSTSVTPPAQQTVSAFADNTNNRIHITPNSSTPSRIDIPNEEDYFEVILPTAGTLMINSIGSYDMVGFLLNTDDTVIDNNDDTDGGANNRNFRISRDVEAGTYYIKVKNYYGHITNDYTLDVRFVSNNVPPTPAPTEDNQTPEYQDDDHVSGITTIALNSSAAGRIDAVGDEDYFKIILPSTGMLTISSTGEDTFEYLLDSNRRTIANAGVHGNGNDITTILRLSAGQYYIKVRHMEPNGTGDYAINVRFVSNNASPTHSIPQAGNNQQPAPQIQQGYQDDDHVVGIATIALNSSVAGRIDTVGDEDLFKIILPSTGMLTINSTGEDVFEYLLSSTSNNRVLANADIQGDGHNMRTLGPLTSGTYYIKVRHIEPNGTGDYVLNVRFVEINLDNTRAGDRVSATPDNRPIDEATLVGRRSTTRGRIDTNGEFDYFRVNYIRSGTMTVQSTGSNDMFGYLLDSNGDEITLNDDAGSGYNFRITRVVEPGTYYIKVRHYNRTQTGDYFIDVSFTPDDTSNIGTDNFTPPPQNDEQADDTAQDDHGDDKEHATQLQTSSRTAGRIDIAGDHDFFRVVLSTAGTLTINSNSSNDMYGFLLDSSGTQIVYDDDTGTDYNFRISRVVEAGTYYIKVKNYYAARTNDYSIDVGFTPDDTSNTGTDNFVSPPQDNNPTDNTRGSDRPRVLDEATLVGRRSTTRGRIDTNGEFDYFRVNYIRSGTMTVQSTGSNDMFGYLLDSNGDEITLNDDAGSGYNFRITRVVEPGTYYIKVRHYNRTQTGDYFIDVSFTSN